MKYIKILFLLFLSLPFVFVSCDDETKVGGTAVEEMAGDWWVTIDAIVNDQAIVDPYGKGHVQMFTYNTAANKDTEMWIDDEKNFWDYKLKVDVNYDTRTFSTKDFVENTSYNCKVKITDGKILKGAALSPSGMPADSIVYMIQFDDDTTPGAIYKISGFRRTGFPADDF